MIIHKVINLDNFSTSNLPIFPSWCLGLFATIDQKLFFDSNCEKLTFYVPDALRGLIRMKSGHGETSSNKFSSTQRCATVTTEPDSDNQDVNPINVRPSTELFSKVVTKCYYAEQTEIKNTISDICKICHCTNVQSDFGLINVLTAVCLWYEREKNKYKTPSISLSDMCSIFDKIARTFLARCPPWLRIHPDGQKVNSIVEDIEGNGWFKLFALFKLFDLSLLHVYENVKVVLNDVMSIGNFQFSIDTMPSVIYKRTGPEQLDSDRLYNCTLEIIGKDLSDELIVANGSKGAKQCFDTTPVLAGIDRYVPWKIPSRVKRYNELKKRH